MQHKFNRCPPGRDTNSALTAADEGIHTATFVKQEEIHAIPLISWDQDSSAQKGTK